MGSCCVDIVLSLGVFLPGVGRGQPAVTPTHRVGVSMETCQWLSGMPCICSHVTRLPPSVTNGMKRFYLQAFLLEHCMTQGNLLLLFRGVVACEVPERKVFAVSCPSVSAW